MVRHSNDGLYKRCDCPHRKWSKCEHPWHFDFYYKKTAHLYGGRAKHRYSLDKIAELKAKTLPRTKGDAESLADLLRSEIRSGTFRDPNHPELHKPEPGTQLMVGDVIDLYIKRHVESPSRKEAAQQTMRWHLALLRRTEIPAGRGQLIKLEDKQIDAVTKADVEAIRDARRRAGPEALAARELWDREAAALKPGQTMNRPKPRLLPGSKGGEVGINRLLERLRHLFSWAIAEGYVNDTPFKRMGVVVVRLDKRVETARHRRLEGDEEQRLLKHASTHLHALIIAALETGCRLGELLGLQWRNVEHVSGPKGEPLARYFVLTADKTKTNVTRRVPVSTRLRAVLVMRRHGPDGKELKPEAHVFGNEVGEEIGSIRTTWRATCRRAKIADLHFHDLRREFGSRLLESGASQHVVRDFLGHANITTTSRYLATTPMSLEHAMHHFERYREIPSETDQSEKANTDAPRDSQTEGAEDRLRQGRG